MDYDEFDSRESQSVAYPAAGEEYFTEGGSRVNVRLSWQQVVFIITVNAILSLIISVGVVLIAGGRVPFQADTMVVGTEVLPAASGDPETSQGQPPPPDTSASPIGVATPVENPEQVDTTAVGTPVEPTVYIVQPGDTLSNIASKFDVSVEDLMRANGLTNPDYVMLGQELLIPIGGFPPVTPTFTPVPVPTDTPLPFTPPTPLPSGTAPPVEPVVTVGPSPTPVPTLTSASPGEIRLVLQVLNQGDLASEMVQVVNQGPFVRLTGWTLTDEDGNVFSFPDFSLWGGGAVNVHTGSGSNTTADLYWDQSEAVWDAGDLVTLSDRDGTAVATYTVPVP